MLDDLKHGLIKQSIGTVSPENFIKALSDVIKKKVLTQSQYALIDDVVRQAVKNAGPSRRGAMIRIKDHGKRR